MFYLQLKPDKQFQHPQSNVIINNNIELGSSPILIIDRPLFIRQSNGKSCSLQWSIYWNLETFLAKNSAFYSQNETATPEQVTQFSQLPLPEELVNLSDDDKIEWKLYQFLLLKPKMVFNTQTETFEVLLDENGNPVYEFQDWELQSYNESL